MSNTSPRYYSGDKPNPKAHEILFTLSQTFHLQPSDYSSLMVQKEKKNPFETLVVTVLSQNSTDKLAVKSFENLDVALGGISPRKLALAPIRKIRDAIKIGGLQEQKASGLKNLSRKLLKEYNGKLDQILDKPFDEARDLLMQLPQVGPKTADVVLVTAAGKSTIPVDTHVDRVSRRLGLAPLKGGYEKVRQSLQSLYKPSEYHRVHLLLIAHGRAYCAAQNPKCSVCPVENYCPYPYKKKE